MSGPVVVQGRPVSAPQQARPANTTSTGTTPTNGTTHHGQKQETRCNDIPFAILFYVNVIAIFAVAILTGPDALESNGEDNNSSSSNNNEDMTREYDGLLYAALICVFLSIFGSLGGVGVMMCIPETLIKVALIFVVIMAGIMMLMSFLSGALGGAVLGLIFFAISICYARAVWPRIPFASANLVTSISAVRANWGVIGYAFIFTFLAGGWSILWTVAFAGVFDETYECSDETQTCSDPNYFYLFLLFISFFFTHQVIQVGNGPKFVDESLSSVGLHFHFSSLDMSPF